MPDQTVLLWSCDARTWCLDDDLLSSPSTFRMCLAMRSVSCHRDGPPDQKGPHNLSLAHLELDGLVRWSEIADSLCFGKSEHSPSHS